VGDDREGDPDHSGLARLGASRGGQLGSNVHLCMHMNIYLIVPDICQGLF